MDEPKIRINGELTSPVEVRKIFSDISTAAVITRKTGFLLRSSFFNGELHLGLLPYFLDGRRAHHYDIKMPDESLYILTGFINRNLTLTFFCELRKLKKKRLEEEDIASFQRQALMLVGALVGNGFDPGFLLDRLTIQFLGELHLQPQEEMTLGTCLEFLRGSVAAP